MMIFILCDENLGDLDKGNLAECSDGTDKWLSHFETFPFKVSLQFGVCRWGQMHKMVEYILSSFAF